MVAPGVLLRHPHFLLPLSSSSYPSSTTPAPPTTSSSSSSSFSFQPRRTRCPCLRTGGGSASGSHAESARPGGFSFRDAGGGGRGGGAGAWEEAEEGAGRGRRWWTGDEWDDDEDSDLLDDDELEQPWEGIWIFKVFKSYGYLLPAVIASMILATGPKAFLMALALPLGQSALSLAIDKLWGNASKVARAKYKPKKKPFARAASDFRRAEEEISRGYKGREACQSWMSSDAVSSGREYKSHAFGGWDELDRHRDYAEGPARQQSSKTTSTSSSRAQAIKKGKLSRRERNKEIPLFLRLLIAVFPFLGSWTRIL